MANNSPHQPDQQPCLLRLEQVSLKAQLGDRYLLEDISFDLFAGDRLAVIGSSGAGKTTLLRLLNRLSEISHGNIFFEDQNLRQIPVIALRRQIALVPQESRLLGMTVRQTLCYPLTLQGMAAPLIQQSLSTWTEQFRIPQDWLDRTEVQLSVGQRQWIAIARALMLQPKVLLLDEPTSALDAGRSAYLLQLLAAQPIAIIMVNHQLDLAQEFSDRVLHLQQGKLLQNLPSRTLNWAELQQKLAQSALQEQQEWE
jgi:D-methionine transport system ATP-binding protein